MGKPLARRAPRVEKLACERNRRFNLRERALPAKDERRAAVAALLLEPALGRAETAIRHRDSGVACGAIGGISRLQQAGEPGAGGSSQIGCANFGWQTRRGADDGGVELFTVRRRGGGEEQRVQIYPWCALERVAQR